MEELPALHRIIEGIVGLQGGVSTNRLLVVAGGGFIEFVLRTGLLYFFDALIVVHTRTLRVGK
jgi:hypothetical protein